MPGPRRSGCENAREEPAGKEAIRGPWQRKRNQLPHSCRKLPQGAAGALASGASSVLVGLATNSSAPHDNPATLRHPEPRKW